MDLNSLPNEMLLGIFKKVNYLTIAGLRKINRRIDAIAMKNHLGTRVPVPTLIFDFRDTGEDKRIHCFLILTVDVHIARFLIPSLKDNDDKKLCHFKYKVDVTDSFQECEEFLNNIQVRRKLVFEGDTLPINDSLIVLLLNQGRRFRGICTLHILATRCGLTFTKENIQKLIATCPNLQRLAVSCGRSAASDLGLIFNEQVLGGRRWEQLYLRGGFLRVVNLGMDSNILCKVVKNSANFDYDGSLPVYTVHELIDFIENCVQEKDFFDTQKWNFGTVPHGITTKEEIGNRLSNINNIEYSVSNSLAFTTFKIRIPTTPEVAVDFSILRAGWF